jgi:hypothetical protein
MLLSVFDFGAIPNTDATVAIAAANTYADKNKVKVLIPANYTFNIDNSDIDTKNFIGEGKLRFSNQDRVQSAQYRKNIILSNSYITTLEDEFGAHSWQHPPNRYTAFSGSAKALGKEYIAARNAKNHYYSSDSSSELVLYILDRNKPGGKILKKTIYSTTKGGDIRDINISILPNSNSDLLIRFVLQTSKNTYENYLMVYSCAKTQVESIRKLNFNTINQYAFGNTLITPKGRLLIAHYSLDGKTTISRSVDIYNKNLKDEILMERIRDFEVSKSAEPTIGYWDDKLIIFYRMSKGVNGRFSYTYDLEGIHNWIKNQNLNLEVHAPFIEPYNNKKTLLMLFSLGSDRSIIGTYSTENLKGWYSTTKLKIAGETHLSQGQSGGYPSFVDYNDNISVASYADFRSSNKKLMTRFDVRLFKKTPLLAENSLEAQINTFNNFDFKNINKVMNTDHNVVNIKLAIKKDMMLKGFYLKIMGDKLNTNIQLLNEAGNIVAVASKIASTKNGFQEVLFCFDSKVSVFPGIYTLRLNSNDNLKLAIGEFPESKVKLNRIKYKTYEILGLDDGKTNYYNNFTIVKFVFK